MCNIHARNIYICSVYVRGINESNAYVCNDIPKNRMLEQREKVITSYDSINLARLHNRQKRVH